MMTMRSRIPQGMLDNVICQHVCTNNILLFTLANSVPHLYTRRYTLQVEPCVHFSHDNFTFLLIHWILQTTSSSNAPSPGSTENVRSVNNNTNEPNGSSPGSKRKRGDNDEFQDDDEEDEDEDEVGSSGKKNDVTYNHQISTFRLLESL